MAMETKKKRGRYTGDKAKERRKRQVKRQQHIQSIKSGEANDELPEALVPEVFNDIKGIYWESLKSVPDPRSPEKRIYPYHVGFYRRE